MLSPTPIGETVEFHHPLAGWTRGTVKSVVENCDPIEDSPHWGCWIRHPIFGTVWALGGEIMDRSFASEKHSYTR